MTIGLQFYISVVSTYELRYPGCADAIYLVNGEILLFNIVIFYEDRLNELLN